MRTHKKESTWMSVSDIMTGLMVIFMFIAINYILKKEKEQAVQNQIIENYKNTKLALLEELNKEFENDFKPENWNAFINEDLSIRFVDERVLFDRDSDSIKRDFQLILDDFFPRYLKILLKKEYKASVAEIRIEGHTDSRGDYMYNVDLSQRRTANVLSYLLDSNKTLISELSQDDQTLIRYWFTANGFSYGRTLDSNGFYTLNTGSREDRAKSRRVEFRIMVKSDDIIQQVINQMGND